MLKISIITAVRNGAETLRGCIESVQKQTIPTEHIIIDGASTDGTFDIIAQYRSSIAKVISEPDNGIYDALNKGIKLASGEVIGLLHGDDFYAHDKVLESVVKVFEEQNVDSCYGDLLYVKENNIDKVIRYWISFSIRGQISLLEGLYHNVHIPAGVRDEIMAGGKRGQPVVIPLL